MPETFTPKTWADGSGGGTPITAAELNRMETGLESMDDRVTAVEDGKAALVHTHTAGAISGLAAVATSGSAADLVSGTTPTARLGSGTASATTYLRGDQSYTDPSLLAAPVHAVGSSGSALTIDASSASGWVKTITLTGNCTVTLSGATAGRVTTLELYLTQDGTGSRTVTWPASVRWDGGSAPTLSTAAAAVDCVVLRTVTSGTTWLGNLAGKGYA